MSQRRVKSDAPVVPEGATKERFEQELKDLATQAERATLSTQYWQQVTLYNKTALVLGLLGIYANVSQLALSPVYGSIPASIWHSKVLMAGCFLGWSGNLFLRRALPLETAQLLPLIASCIPTIQFFLGGFSEVLGAKRGPAVTEALTLLPLAVVSAACAADYLEGVHLDALPQFVADAAPGIGSWGLFKFMEAASHVHLRRHVGQVFLLTRVGMEMLLAASYTVFAPSKYLLLAIPALLHTTLFNTHVMTSMATASLNNTLISEQWLLLDRKESVTGYISVLQNEEMGFRVMRCDHSLLGGEWVRHKGEPIYGVFVMLEAVRLVDREIPLPDAESNALVIGLGIGTTPSAFVTHGINTTVVEIDPVVHEFAARYFDFEENNPPAIADAVSYTADLVESQQRYDYIVHDVFTGGAEPAELFTLEFLQGLVALLKPDGVIAINYAGDLNLPAPKLIYRTIKQVFPSCRIFRESPRVEENVEKWGSDFTNLVIFCRKTAEAITFRGAVEEDFLGSSARRHFLVPREEVLESEVLEGDDSSLLLKNSTAKLVGWHEQSALGHWSIMRTVVPAKLWERW